jgi:gliding motility-associated-like protein
MNHVIKQLSMNNLKSIYFAICVFMVANVSRAQVVINEVQHWPSGAQGLIDSGKEYIELYNTSCSSVDISCYILGTRYVPNSNPGSTLITGGSILIPKGTVIGPKGHFVIGTSLSSVDVSDVDFKTDQNTTYYCATGNFVLPNSDGWLSLYDESGNPLDAIYWTTLAGQDSKISTDDDYDDAPCVPSSNTGCTTDGIALLSAKDIKASSAYTSLITYVGQTNGTPLNAPSTPTGKTFSRVPDGGSWQRDVNPSINGSNCNGVCESCCDIKLNATVKQPDCGKSNGEISFAPTPNTDFYLYTWPDPIVYVPTANSVSNLAAGSYTITIAANTAGCSKDTTIVLTSTGGPKFVNATVKNATCNSPGSVKFNLPSTGSYEYGVNGFPFNETGDFPSIPAGSYTLTIREKGNVTCKLDSTVTVLGGQLTGTVASTPNSSCVSCNYSGPTILINEININPTSGDGSIFGPGPNTVDEGEWIELYNPNWCDSVDISGYILGSFNSTGSFSIPASSGMGFVIPDKTKKVPPLGFAVVRGKNAPVPTAGLGIIDVVVDNVDNNACVTGGASSRIWFENGGGWFAFYDADGKPQDAISWGTVTPTSDLNGRPCIPTNNKLPAGVTQLGSYNEIGTGVNIGTVTQGRTKVRFPDAKAWSTTESPLETATYGSCNDPSNCLAATGVDCNGTATVTMTNGTAPYTYAWSDDKKQAVANATGLCPGTYTVTVTDNAGCSQTFTTEVNDDKFTIDATSQDPSCGNNDGSIQVTADPSTLPYTYTWSPNATNTTSTAAGLTAGTYTVAVSAGGCVLDTTITLLASPAIVGLDVSKIDPTCVKNGELNVTNVKGGTQPFTYGLNGSGFTSSASFVDLKQGQYKLTVKDDKGCVKDTVVNVIGIFDFFVNIPNVFTPNGDKSNDVWSVSTGCVEKLNVVILNRWGNVVHEYNDVNGEWDGRTNGEKVAQGVYFYRADIVYSGGEKETKHGNITVIYE